MFRLYKAMISMHNVVGQVRTIRRRKGQEIELHMTNHSIDISKVDVIYQVAKAIRGCSYFPSCHSIPRALYVRSTLSTVGCWRLLNKLTCEQKYMLSACRGVLKLDQQLDSSMAEALGILGSVISVYQLADRATQVLTKILHAPFELLALHNELSDLVATLRTVEECVRVKSSENMLGSGMQHIAELVANAKNHVMQVNQLVHMRFLKSGTLDGDPRIFRMRWLRAKTIVENHRLALRDIRGNIMTELISINWYVITAPYLSFDSADREFDSLAISRIPLLLEEISLISSQAQASQVNISNQILRQLTTQSNLSGTLLDNYNEMNRRLLSATESRQERDETHQGSWIDYV